MLNRTRRLATRLRRRATLHLGGSSFLMLLALFVGLGGGLGAWGFRELIGLFHHLFLEEGMAFLGSPWLLPLIPAAGGLLVGGIVLTWAREARGHGVPEVMAAVATENGRIRPRVVVIKALASALCIGSGGSVGREGPIVQIGSALGSALAQLFRVSAQHMKILVGCGAAAGISATFNAPIAGAIFALEVILGDFRLRSFSPIVVSSVLATAFIRFVEGGDYKAFNIPEYTMASPVELVFYLVLGGAAALAAVSFTRLVYFSEDLFEKLPVNEYAKPVLGGLGVGVIALWYSQVFGVGYETITAIIKGHTEVTLIVILFAAKFVATCLTLGSGGSGGIFAPSLFLGATVGGAFGFLVKALFPAVTAHPGAYALVGMAAVVAGTTHAPLSAMLILFELTDDYKIILPLMLATTVSTLLCRGLFSDSIYTRKLSRRGLKINLGIDESVLSQIKAKEVYSPEYPSIAANTHLGEIVDLLQESEFTDFPVLDGQGGYLGSVSFEDIRRFLTDRNLYRLLTASDVMCTETATGHGEMSLMEVLQIMADSGLKHLPILAGDGSRRLLGVITRGSLMRRYDRELRKRLS